MFDFISTDLPFFVFEPRVEESEIYPILLADTDFHLKIVQECYPLKKLGVEIWPNYCTCTDWCENASYSFEDACEVHLKMVCGCHPLHYLEIQWHNAMELGIVGIQCTAHCSSTELKLKWYFTIDSITTLMQQNIINGFRLRLR